MAEGAMLVVGLGNPGREYEGSRHNVGWAVAGRVASQAGADMGRRKFSGRFGEGRLGKKRVFFILPMTYMNLSGKSVGPAAGFYQIAPEQVVVIHDDADLEFGRLQIKAGGGHGGHNGLRSIAEGMGSKAFLRVRVGIGRPEGETAGRRDKLADYVLSRFDQDEDALEWVLGRAAQAVVTIVEDGVTTAMNRFNPWPPPDGRPGGDGGTVY